MTGDADFCRKRKNFQLDTLSPFNPVDGLGSKDYDHPDHDHDLTTLSLSLPYSCHHRHLDHYSLQSPPLPPPPQVALHDAGAMPIPDPVAAPVASAPRGCGRRRVMSSAAREMARNETIVPPFPWATDRRATIYSFESLVSRRIEVIQGTVQCKKCEKSFEIEYNLKQKFIEIGRYIADNKASMRDRAPLAWMNPALPRCKFCNQDNIAKPVLPHDKDRINWLFLLLGQMIGCCTLDQLKYFCEHTKNHRTGAKDRIVYYTYLGLCKQLDPAGPFDP
ncbi:hypothetical protein MLD38_027013 [Melastoma candidum]|uniref:Uncharacterized protein n=1 Tax=Melastoma candidum TaxID=119954 RepID=A0ACB9P071_9MYRT|nr:hypothetical protein MLD38_027013 [Melastoma candidum]